MKKITILMLLVMMSGINVLFAQSQGDMYVGTLAGVNVSKSSWKDANGTKHENDPQTILLVAPGFHYFVADNFRIGLQMEFTELMTKDNDTKYRNGVLAIGGAVSYYFQIADKFYYTPEVGMYFIHENDKQKLGNTTNSNKYNGFSLPINIAQVEFRPTSHLGFSASIMSLRFKHLKPKGSDSKSNNFEFDTCLNPVIGFKYYF